MPTINVDLLDSKVKQTQKRQLAKSLTKVLSETLGYPDKEVTVIFKSTSSQHSQSRKARRPWISWQLVPKASNQ